MIRSRNLLYKILPLVLLVSCSTRAKVKTEGTRKPETDYNAVLGSTKSCFVMIQVSSGKRIIDHNRNRCEERLPPDSTFKIAAAVMAFENGILKDENQVIKWDGVKHERAELNQDQTPITWMDRSAIWVTQWITPQLKNSELERFLKMFNYGNQDFSGGVTKAWVDSSLKISADEQVEFLTNFWAEKFPLKKTTYEKTKKVIFIKTLGDQSELYGKTGTGCVEEGCDKGPGKMLGWFVGVVKTNTDAYVFAANASDEKPQTGHAGPKLRQALTDFISKMEIVK